MFEERATVVSNTKVLPDTFLLKLEVPVSAMEFAPGQFAMLSTISGNGYLLRRPLSIHKVEGGYLSFLYSVIGKGTGFLSKLKARHTIKILAPLGQGYRLPDNREPVLLVAGGRGIAPLSFLADKALQAGIKTTMLIGAKSSSLLLPEKYLPNGVNVTLSTEDGSQGYKGRITELLLSQNQKSNHIYACGPSGMYKTMSDILLGGKRGLGEKLPEIQVSLEARMACGVGACYGCVIQTLEGRKKVCSDGPVFDLEKLILDRLVI